MKRARTILAVLTATLGLGVARGQPPATVRAPQIMADMRARLESLSPSNPRAYFEIGEEIADAATDQATLNLARRLYVLALTLDRARAGTRLSASACLALADLAVRERDRRWLRSLAGTLDQRFAGPAWVRGAEARVASQAGLAAATTLGAVRSGDGVRARALLADPAAHALLRSCERLLDPAGLPGALLVLEREADRWPCPECHNQRIVRRFGSGRDPVFRLCTNCNGNPGPPMSIPELVTHLRLESQLLNGVQRSWSAQIAADRGAPLRDPDPSDVAPAFGFNPAQSIFRNGEWVEPGAAAPAAQPVPEPPAQPVLPGGAATPGDS